MLLLGKEEEEGGGRSQGSGEEEGRNGVGVILKEEYVKSVLEVKRVSHRVMSMKLEIEGVMMNAVSAYAPQVGCEMEEKEEFLSELDEVVESVPKEEKVVIGADFSGHLGERNRGDGDVMVLCQRQKQLITKDISASAISGEGEDLIQVYPFLMQSILPSLLPSTFLTSSPRNPLLFVIPSFSV
eukprot:superscaffoldBa00004900_g19616